MSDRRIKTHNVKADIEKNFGGKCCPWLILTDSEKAICLNFASESFVRNVNKRFWSWTQSEKFIFLANIRHVRFNMVNSKHRYCGCLLIKICRPYPIVFTFHNSNLSDEKLPKMKHTFLFFWNLKPLVTCNKMNEKFAYVLSCITFAHWCVTRHSHFPLSLKLETWLGKPTPKQTFFREVIFWMHYFEWEANWWEISNFYVL